DGWVAAPGGEGMIVLYDEQCGACSASVEWLGRQRCEIGFRFLDESSDAARALVPDRPVNEMAVVSAEGQVWYGGAAWVVCFGNLTLFRWCVPWLGHPWVLPLVRKLYRVIAENRYFISRMLGKEGAACRLKQKLG
ncbi:MAG: DUF393 domain-containing protein, partial [Acidobacteriota bacterium]